MHAALDAIRILALLAGASVMPAAAWAAGSAVLTPEPAASVWGVAATASPTETAEDVDGVSEADARGKGGGTVSWVSNSNGNWHDTANWIGGC